MAGHCLRLIDLAPRRLQTRLEKAVKGSKDIENTILPNDLREIPRQEDDPQRRKWRLTQEAFDQFLCLLDLDRDRAGESYETLRRNLIHLFIWRGCRDPETDADETINRVIRKIDEGEEVRDVIAYAHGVARRLLLEIFKKQEREQIGIDELPPLTAQPERQDDDENGVLCLRRCLNRLPEESRQLIVLYYQGEKSVKIENRKRLAESLRITLNALRYRAFDLRQRLQGCIERCMQRV
jgi:DNA-directed RNA polymerase specialized sigma24 family protein